MSTYVIGDVQGCFASLEKLLKEIKFDTSRDVLWFAGDLVNRGPASLEVLRFVKSLGKQQVCVLGNHDLHLLAVASGAAAPRKGDTLDAILQAPDRAELIDWLHHCPLMHVSSDFDVVLVHAGLAPQWTVSEAMILANEVQTVLQGDAADVFFADMYGNEPANWEPELEGMPRLRCIVNYMTRMRFCREDGSLDLEYKGQIKDKPADLIPWFEMSDRKNAETDIIFGHWAALNGQTAVPHLYPVDTGCVWGNCLTALRLEDRQRFTIPCH